MKMHLLIAAAFLLCCCTPEYRSVGGYAQGGIWRVTYNPSGVKESPSSVRKAVEGILEAVDTTLSGYNRKSLLSRRNAGKDVQLNGMFREMEAIAGHYRELTGGAFDVTAGPLFDIWGFGFTSDSLPSPEDVQLALERSRKGEVLNFNAIAQGYSCDLVAEYLRSIGARDYLVDIGEIYCEGFNSKGLGWSVGIDTPRDGNDTPGAELSGVWHSDGAGHGIVTSGNYRKYYVRDGRKYSHTIDPRTGYPVEHDLLSATVVAPSAAEADALATFFMVIGPQEARSWVESHPGIQACLISSEEIWTSDGFQECDLSL